MAKKPDINDVERPPKKCFGEKLYYSKDFLGAIWLDQGGEAEPSEGCSYLPRVALEKEFLILQNSGTNFAQNFDI